MNVTIVPVIKKEYYPCKINETSICLQEILSSLNSEVYPRWRVRTNSYKRNRGGARIPKSGPPPAVFRPFETCNYANSASISISKCAQGESNDARVKELAVTFASKKAAGANDRQRVCSRQKLKVFRFSREEAENATSIWQTDR